MRFHLLLLSTVMGLISNINFTENAWFDYVDELSSLELDEADKYRRLVVE